MPYLLGGLVILLGLMGLVYLFVHEDPRKLARNLEWAVDRSLACSAASA